MLFFGLLQHCAMPNRSDKSRTGLILQYLPKYVRPMEDLKVTKQNSRKISTKSYFPFLHKNTNGLFLPFAHFCVEKPRNCFSNPT